MLDLDQVAFCEHDREESDDCPICGGGKPEHSVFDPHVWVERYLAASRETADFPDELMGVPLN